MRNRVFRSLSIGVLVLWFVTISAGQSEIKEKTLPNFHQVNSQLFRGAQPKPNGFKRLAELGIKTIVNLRDDDEHAVEEEQLVKQAGLRYFNIPFPRLGGPRAEQMQKVLAVIYAPQNQPVFVHCRRGSDRTGTVIAIYRLERDGWTPDQAQAEANRHGMGFWHMRMRNYIRDYYRRLVKEESHR